MRELTVIATPIYQARRKRISLTALIDVVFILLLFFMLTSSFSEWRTINISAPSEAHENVSRLSPQLLLLHADNSLTLHNQAFHLEHYKTLPSTQLHAFDFSRPLVVLTESDVQVLAITDLLGMLKQLGFGKTTLGGLLPTNDQE